MDEDRVRVEFAGSHGPDRPVAEQKRQRPLSAREAETLRFILSHDDPRLVPLREQAEVASVRGMCHCGCATIDLAVDRV